MDVLTKKKKTTKFFFGRKISIEKLNLMKAICGFIFPKATLTKSSSLNEKDASGFPPSYGPKYTQPNKYSYRIVLSENAIKFSQIK